MGHFVKLYFHTNLKNVFSGHIWILHSLSFTTVPKTPKTEFGWKSYAQNKIRGQNSGGKLKISQTLRNVFAIVANFAMSCEFGKVIANLAMGCEFGNVVCEVGKVVCEFGNGLRIWQCCCEFGNVVCEVGKAIANLAMWFAKLAKWFAKLAMRNFAKLLKFLCEKRSSQMHSECG